MVDTRHETTLSYKLDARGLRDARREFEKTFQPNEVKQLNEQMKTMQRQLAGVTKEQIQLNTQMAKVKDGSDAYKTLERALGAVEKRARSVRGAMANIASLMPREPTGAARGAGPAQAAAPPPGGARMGLMAGAAGVGSYLGARAAGVGARGAGLLQGQGPISTVTAGIPVIGGLAAMAEGAVGQFLAFRQAQMGAMPFMAGGGLGGLGALGERARAFAQGKVAIPGQLSSIEIAQAGETGLEQAFGFPSEADARRDQTLRHRRTMGLANAMAATRDHERQTAKRAAERARTVDVAPVRAGTREGLVALTEARLLQPGLAELDPLGPEPQFAAREVGLRKGRAARKKEQDAARVRRREAETGFIRNQIQATTQEITNIGARAGLSPTEALQAFQQQGRITGVATGAQFQQALAAQRFGVEAGTTAQIFRAQRRGRGGLEGDNINAVAQAIGGAVALSLEGSEVNEHLAMIAGLQQEAEQRGMKISREGIQTMALALKGGGVAGIQAQRISAGFTRQAQGLAMTGAKDAESIALLRAAGFQPGTGFENYFDALTNLENVTGDPEMMFRFMRNLTEGADLSTVKGRKKAAFTIRSTRFGRGAVGSLGGAMDIVKAMRGGAGMFQENLAKARSALKPGAAKLLEGFEGGGAGFLAEVGGVTAAPPGGGGPGEAARLLLGPLRAQAEVNTKLIEVGGLVSGTVKDIQLDAAKLALSVGSIHTIIDEIHPAIQTISKLLGGGIEGLASLIAGAIIEAKGGEPTPGG